MAQVIRWSSLAVWLVWLIVYWRGGIDLISGLVRSVRSSLSRYEAFLILGIVILSNLLLWTGYLITTGRIEDQLSRYAKLLSTIGEVLILAGAIGTFYCRQRLGGLWSARTVLLLDHTLVDSGPYRLVRHPIYGFACVMTLGTVMVFMTWWNVLAGVLVVASYALRALEEEKMLTVGLPGYRDYQQRVRYRLAPWIW